MTSFLLYARETRHKVKEEFPHYSMKEIAAKLGEMWRALNDEEKEVFSPCNHSMLMISLLSLKPIFFELNLIKTLKITKKSKKSHPAKQT